MGILKHDLSLVSLTTAQWASINPKLGNRDVGYNSTTGEWRMGPGYWKECASLGNAYTVRAATTAAITIATALNAGDTLDGVVLVAGDLVLVKNQATASPSAPEANGIYVVGTTPARVAAFDTWNEHIGSLIAVKEGTTNTGLLYRCDVASGGTLDTTSITYTLCGQGPVTLAGYKQLVLGAPNKTTPAAADIIMLEDAVTGQIKYCTVAQLQTVINV